MAGATLSNPIGQPSEGRVRCCENARIIGIWRNVAYALSTNERRGKEYPRFAEEHQAVCSFDRVAHSLIDKL
jgi:hypothetical protein